VPRRVDFPELGQGFLVLRVARVHPYLISSRRVYDPRETGPMFEAEPGVVGPSFCSDVREPVGRLLRT
jgi:predicted amidohydrolase